MGSPILDLICNIAQKYSLMKYTLLFITACFLSGISYAQNLKVTSRKKTVENLRKEATTTIATGYDKEYDEALKFAFEKYWKFTPIKYVDRNDKKAYADCYLKEWDGRNGGKYDWSFFSFSKGGLIYDQNFDDFRKGDTKGTDSSFHMKAIKVIPYIMCLSAEVKRLEEWGELKYAFHKGLKEKVKDYNVLIEKEYITTYQLSENPFKQYLKKYEISSANEIDKRIREQKNTDNTAILTIGRADYAIHISIIDIKTGDLLYYDNVSFGTFAQGKKMTDGDIEKLLSNLEKWNDK